jgi:hypothetical protein
MICFIEEKQSGKNVAGPKARNDVYAILRTLDIQAITLPVVLDMTARAEHRGTLKKVRDNLLIRDAWKTALKQTHSGDVVILQFPILRHPFEVSSLLRKKKKEGVLFCLFIHDLEILRNFQDGITVGLKKKMLIREEKQIMDLADYMVIHNSKMEQCLSRMGYNRKKMINLHIFDYLVPNPAKSRCNIRQDYPVIIAGNLNPAKVGYLAQLPEDVDFNLYGIGYQKQDKDNIHYFGSFTPDELPGKLQGSFGLIWDGPSAKTCEGVFGEYLKINNPHKTSLYLASGIPVLVWRQAAIADFVQEHHCGIVIDSLDQIHDILRKLSEQDYQKLVLAAGDVSQQLTGGYYTRNAVRELEKHQ